jgi:hypothetical protein
MRASAPVISVALPCSGVLDPKQILYICTLTYSSTPKSSTEKKTLEVKIKQLFNNMNCTKLVHLQLQKLRCIDFKGSYINSAKTYCQSTIVADIWSSILLLLAAAANYCVPARFEIRGKSRGTSASTNSAKLRSWYY